MDHILRQLRRPQKANYRQINRYHEKPLQQRLDLLYQRNLYPLAISLAQKSGMDVQQQNIIYRKYGDHLYQKGDYDSAMSQYIKAIDNTEPSQVIRKVGHLPRPGGLVTDLVSFLIPNESITSSNISRSSMSITKQRLITPRCSSTATPS